MIRSIARNSAFILIPAAAISAFLSWPDMPIGILSGGLLGILNIKALAWSVEGTLGTSQAGPKTLFFSQFRFVIIAITVFLLAYLRLASLAGILAGFTVVFIQVLITGFRHSRKKDG